VLKDYGFCQISASFAAAWHVLRRNRAFRVIIGVLIEAFLPNSTISEREKAVRDALEHRSGRYEQPFHDTK
jgi:hypothetical protein